MVLKIPVINNFENEIIYNILITYQDTQQNPSKVNTTKQLVKVVCDLLTKNENFIMIIKFLKIL